MSFADQLFTFLVANPEEHLKFVFIPAELHFPDHLLGAVDQHVIVCCNADVAAGVDEDRKEAKIILLNLFPLLERDLRWFVVNPFAKTNVRFLFRKLTNIVLTPFKIRLNDNPDVWILLLYSAKDTQCVIRARMVFHINTDKIILRFRRFKNFFHIRLAKAHVDF